MQTVSLAAFFKQYSSPLLLSPLSVIANASLFNWLTTASLVLTLESVRESSVSPVLFDHGRKSVAGRVNPLLELMFMEKENQDIAVTCRSIFLKVHVSLQRRDQCLHVRSPGVDLTQKSLFRPPTPQ